MSSLSLNLFNDEEISNVGGAIKRPQSGGERVKRGMRWTGKRQRGRERGREREGGERERGREREGEERDL